MENPCRELVQSAKFCILTYGLNNKAARKCLEVYNSSSSCCGRCCSATTASYYSEEDNTDVDGGSLQISHPAVLAFGMLLEYSDTGLQITFPQDINCELNRGAKWECENATIISRNQFIEILNGLKEEYRAELYHPVHNNCIKFTLRMINLLNPMMDDANKTKTKFQKWLTWLLARKDCINGLWKKATSTNKCDSQQRGSGYCDSGSSIQVGGCPTRPIRNPGIVGTEEYNWRLILQDRFPMITESERAKMKEGMKPYRGALPAVIYHPVMDIHGFFCDLQKYGIRLMSDFGPLGPTDKVIDLKTKKSHQELHEWLFEKRLNYNRDNFDFVKHNCSKFGLELCKFLGLQDEDIPWEWEVQIKCFKIPENGEKIKRIIIDQQKSGVSNGNSYCYN